MYLVEFNRDTELIIVRPPYGVYFEKGEEIIAKNWYKKDDMIHVITRDYGQLIIFGEDITISEKTKVHS